MADQVVPQVFLHEGQPVQGWRDGSCYYLTLDKLLAALLRCNADFTAYGNEFSIGKHTLGAEFHHFDEFKLKLFPILIFTGITLIETNSLYLIDDNWEELNWEYNNTARVWTSIVMTPFWLDGRITREGNIVSMFLCAIGDEPLVETFGPNETGLFYWKTGGEQ